MDTGKTSSIEKRRLAGNIVQLMYFVCRYTEPSSAGGGGDDGATAVLDAEVGCIAYDLVEHITCLEMGKKMSSVNDKHHQSCKKFYWFCFSSLPTFDRVGIDTKLTNDNRQFTLNLNHVINDCK